jgi:predicted transcriptional regulator
MADTISIKNMNIKKVRNILYKHDNLSKSELVSKTGLSFPTISRTIDSLLKTGELLEKGVYNSTGGRCAKIFSIDPLFSVFMALTQLSYKTSSNSIIA